MTLGMLLGHLTFGLLVFLLLPYRPSGWRKRGLLLLALIGLSFAEVEGLSLGDYTRSYTDDLAITTMLWLTWCAAARLFSLAPMARQQQRELTLCFGALALFLYPATLGLSILDPYRLGFAPLPLLMMAGGLCLWFWWRRNRVAVALLSAATLAFWLDLKDSDNYWDYLIDPLFGLYCLAYLAADLWRTSRGLKLKKSLVASS